MQKILLKAELAGLVLSAKELPPLNPWLPQMFKATEDELYESLMRLANSDPAVLARFVAVANSVYFGVPDKMLFTAQACLSRIGLALARELVCALMLYPEVPGIHSPEYTQLYHTALEAGLLARFIRKHVAESVEEGAPFLVALLSYVGELYVVRERPDLFADMALLSEEEARPLLQDVTLALCEGLGVPPFITRSVAFVWASCSDAADIDTGEGYTTARIVQLAREFLVTRRLVAPRERSERVLGKLRTRLHLSEAALTAVFEAEPGLAVLAQTFKA